MCGQLPPKTSGIYCIFNQRNAKFYIGSSSQIHIRLTAHRRQLNSGTHKNPRLQRSWNKHGADAFEFWLIEHVADATQLLSREQYWLDLYRPHEDGIGYNIADRAEGGMWLGKKLPAAMREKIGKAHVGKKRSAQARKNMSEAGTGKITTAEHREKISLAGKGKRRSPEVRARMSAGIKAGWAARRAKFGESGGNAKWSAEDRVARSASLRLGWVKRKARADVNAAA